MSTAADLDRFFERLLTGELGVRLRPAADARYGLGVAQFETACGPVLGHTGNLLGTISVVAARTAAGEFAAYDVCANTHRHHILDVTRVPAGGALAVDRQLFSDYVTARIEAHPLIRDDHLHMVAAHPPHLDADGSNLGMLDDVEQRLLEEAVLVVPGHEGLRRDAVAAGEGRLLVGGVGRRQRVHAAACGLRRVMAVSSARMMNPVTMAKIICGWPRSISQP